MYGGAMKVIQTVVATGPNGEDLGSLVEPVDMKWYEGDSLINVAHAVTQILADAEDRKFTKIVSIHIEL